MLKAFVLTVSDRGARGEREDKTGPTLIEELRKDNIFTVIDYAVIEDGYSSVRKKLIECISNEYSLLLTNGGTGIS